jgi:hypothetical protein
MINQTRYGENHINKLLELINVNNIGGSGTPISYKQTPSTSQAYHGVFVGDSAASSQTTLTGQQL